MESRNKVKGLISNYAHDVHLPTLETVRIFGVKDLISEVFVNGRTVADWYSSDGTLTMRGLQRVIKQWLYT